MPRKRSLLLLSDRLLFRQAIATVIRDDGYQVIDQATKAPLRKARPELTLVDLEHTDVDTMTLVDDLHDELTETRFVLIGNVTRIAASIDQHDDLHLELPRADLAILKSALAGRAPSSSAALARARDQWSRVTARQREVLRWLAAGLDNPGIAAKLRVGIRAIKAHISALLALFGLDSRTQLALLATEGGLRP